MTLFAPPRLDAHDRQVLDEVDAARSDLAAHVHPARRWTGGLRRTTQARAIQGSTTIEGYVVSEADALAAVDDDAPQTTYPRCWPSWSTRSRTGRCRPPSAERWPTSTSS